MDFTLGTQMVNLWLGQDQYVQLDSEHYVSRKQPSLDNMRTNKIKEDIEKIELCGTFWI